MTILLSVISHLLLVTRGARSLPHSFVGNNKLWKTLPGASQFIWR